MSLKHISILHKFLLTILVMGLVSSLLAAVSWREISSLRNTMLGIGAREVAAREAMDLRMDIIAISRMTYQLVLTPQEAASFVAEATRRKDEMMARFPIIEAPADSEELRLLADVKPVLASYFASIDDLLALAARGDQAGLEAGLSQTLAAQKIVTDTVKLYSTYSGETMGAQRADAEASANLAIIVMISSAVVGILAGLALSIVIGQRAIVAPVRALTAKMDELAGGNLDITIAEADRRDEIGEMGRAVVVFQDNARQISALSAEEAARAKGLADRAQLMDRLGREITVTTEAASRGDFNGRVSTNYPEDELNAIAGGVNALVETVDRGLSETGAVLSALAQTDLTQRIEGRYEGAFAQLRDDTNAVADKLTDIVGGLRQTSRALKTATGEILSGTNDLAERTTRQAATIEETSAAIEQLADTVRQNADRAQEASQAADAVTRTAEEGGAVMTQTTEAMQRITTSSAKISNIIGLIDDVAFQTNLLALNASVEAARAGEAGKGFAVVAVEVRRLAQSAAEASREVKQLVEQSGAEVDAGSKLVVDAASKLTAMLDMARSSNTLMQGIARESAEQASAIREVTIAVRQLDEMTQHNAALVEETNAAIEQTEGQASELDAVVDIFHLGSAEPVAKPVSRPAKAPVSVGNTAIAADWDEF